MSERKQLAKTSSQYDYILLDGSGSMTDQWASVLGSLDAYVAALRAQNTNTHIVLSQFGGSRIDHTCRNCAINEWKPFSEFWVEPVGGGTPLYDAIQIMGRNLRDLDPPRCAITIATDGYENGSQFTSLPQAKAILDWCRAKGWQVTFIGCEFDNSKVARELGADKASAIGVQTRLLAQATAELAKKRARYGLSGAPMHWSAAEQQQFGGYLAPPSS